MRRLVAVRSCLHLVRECFQSLLVEMPCCELLLDLDLFYGLHSEKKGRDPDALVDSFEVSEFKSVCGSLCWLAGLTRADLAQEINMLQKRQAAPRVKDCLRANALARKA